MMILVQVACNGGGNWSSALLMVLCPQQTNNSLKLILLLSMILGQTYTSKCWNFAFVSLPAHLMKKEIKTLSLWPVAFCPFLLTYISFRLFMRQFLVTRAFVEIIRSAQLIVSLQKWLSTIELQSNWTHNSHLFYISICRNNWLTVHSLKRISSLLSTTRRARHWWHLNSLSFLFL